MAQVARLNLHRRHLTSSQRAALAVDVTKELEVEARERQRENARDLNKRLGRGQTNEQLIAHSSAKPEPQAESESKPYDDEPEKEPRQSKPKVESERAAQSRDIAADLVGSSARYVQDAKTLKVTRPELFNKVKAGDLTRAEVKVKERHRRLSGTRSNPQAKEQVGAKMPQPASYSDLKPQPESEPEPYGDEPERETME